MTHYQELYDAKYHSAKAKGWSGWGSADREDLGKTLFDRLRSNAHVPDKGRTLELGCGEGQLSRKLSNFGYEMAGVDLSEVALSWARVKDPEENIFYFQEDLTTDTARLHGKYDLIIA